MKNNIKCQTEGTVIELSKYYAISAIIANHPLVESLHQQCHLFVVVLVNPGHVVALDTEKLLVSSVP